MGKVTTVSTLKSLNTAPFYFHPTPCKEIGPTVLTRFSLEGFLQVIKRSKKRVSLSVQDGKCFFSSDGDGVYHAIDNLALMDVDFYFEIKLKLLVPLLVEIMLDPNVTPFIDICMTCELD